MRTPGIAAKLFLAFGCIFFLALVAVITGWQGFRRIADTQNVVIDQAIPGLRQAHNLSEFNALIGSSASQFERADNEADRQALSKRLVEQVDALNAYLDQAGARNPGDEQLETLRLTLADISRNLHQHSELVRQRLLHQQRFAQLAAELIATTDELNELADSLVANAAATTTAIISSLYDLVEEGAANSRLFSVFDRIVEVDIDAMERMYELRLRSSNLRALFNRVIKESAADNLLELRRRIGETLSILRRRINEINDPQRQARAVALLNAMELNNGPLYVYGIFESKLALLEIKSDLDRLAKENDTLSAQLNLLVSELTAEGSTLVNRVSLAAKQSLDASRRLFGWIALIALVLTVFIFWGYVRRHVIRRLLSLEAATRSIAAGDYAVDVDIGGTDELSRMARALRVFRNNAVEKRRVDEELLEHKTHLESLVGERTAQLEQANENLRREAEQHAVARDKAEQANRAKTAFLATMSHELRTPLSGALGTLSLLRETPLSRQQRNYLSIVDDANTTLLDIVNNILGYSHVEAGKLKVEPRCFDVRELVRNVVNLTSAQALEKGNRVTARVDDGVARQLVGDSGKLQQILLNLIGNAIKFSEAGEIRVDVTVRTPATKELRLAFEVSDTGVGIPEDMQDDVFCAFTQVDSSISREHGGIGLGLAICDRLVTAMGGEISLRSKPGEGTTVRFALPVSIADTVDERARPLITQSALTDDLNVLVVEDDTTNRMVVESYLRKLGHAVWMAESGVAALQVFETEPIDLILLDISLPGMDGLEVFGRIRHNPAPDKRTVPVIAMSAHVFKEEVDQYLGAGMNCFLGKPFSLADLETAIARGRAGGIATLPGDHTASPLLDRSAGTQDLRQLGAATFRTLVETFGRAAEQYLSEIEHHVASGDAERVAEIAHKMRGAAGNFGLLELCHLLGELERACKSGCLPDDREFASRLRRTFAASLGALDRLLEESAVEVAAPITGKG